MPPPIITEERPSSTEERVSRIEGEQRCLAAKADVAEVLAEIAKSEARASARFAELHAEMAKSEARNVRWLIAIITVAVAVITIIFRLMG